MVAYIHKTLASGRWYNFSFCEQMANIGSEISRSIHWYGENDKEEKEKSVERALELIDLTISDKRWKGRLREIFRLREVVCDLFLGNNDYNVSLESLKNYFLFFSLKHINEKNV